MLNHIKDWWHALWVEHYELTVWFEDQTVTNLEDNTATTTRSHLYYVPNGDSVSDNNRLFDVSIEPQETVYIEPAYPITLTTTGDTVSIGATSAQVNVFINGDKES